MTASDPMYPQYAVTVKWVEDGEDERSDDLPEGRIHNSTVLHRMYREDPGAEEVERAIREDWWPRFIQAERPTSDTTIAERNPSEPEIMVEYKGEESWALSWFEHWTFDVGQTDAEALESFRRYVSRYEHMQDIYPGEAYPDGYRCLMGAEDRWRWTGGREEDGSRTSPPCRCEHCQEQGKIRIGH